MSQKNIVEMGRFDLRFIVILVYIGMGISKQEVNNDHAIFCQICLLPIEVNNYHVIFAKFVWKICKYLSYLQIYCKN